MKRKAGEMLDNSEAAVVAKKKPYQVFFRVMHLSTIFFLNCMVCDHSVSLSFGSS